MPLTTITAPLALPVSVEEVKSFARVDDAQYDVQIAMLIKAATAQAEAITGRALITRTFELVLDEFPAAEIDLQVPDVRAIVSAKYLDPAGAEQTIAASGYAVDDASSPSWLLPAAGTAWPATLTAANAVKVRFTAGYGDTAASVPDDVRLWIIMHAVEGVQSPDGLRAADTRGNQYVNGLLDPHRGMRAL